MTDQMLHTPDGVRDIYNGECKQKLLLQDRLHAVLTKYGYRDIQTPTFEFSIFSVKKSVQLLPRICTSFLTKTEIRLYCVLILHLLLPEVLQNIMRKTICR